VTNYAKGRAREYRSARLLEAAGYTVARMAGSHGLFDLICWDRHSVVFCQVKAGRGPSPAEREAITECLVPTNAKKLVHWWKPRARGPVVLELE
jgi:Holliday junction resolvase-like predicted endonuclease